MPCRWEHFNAGNSWGEGNHSFIKIAVIYIFIQTWTALIDFLTFASHNRTLRVFIWPEQVLLKMLRASRNQRCITYTHFSELLPSLCNHWRLRESEKSRESDGNNQGNKNTSWLGDDGAVFPQAFSAWLLFLDLSLLWHWLLLLSVASGADGLGTVLGLQLRGYQGRTQGRGEGAREAEEGRIQPSKHWVTRSNTHDSFAFTLEALRK